MDWTYLGSLTVAAMLTAACEVKSVGDIDDDSSGSDSGGQTTTDPSTGPTSATETDDSGSETFTTVNPETGDTTDTETTGACPPVESICDPAPLPMFSDLQWSFDNNQLLETEGVDVRCTVSEFETPDDTMRIVLECDEEELSQHTIVLPLSETIATTIAVGSNVRLDYTVVTPFWTEIWMALRDDQGTLLAGAMSASNATPRPGFFAPLGIGIDVEACPIECMEGLCGTAQRDAIVVDIDGQLFPVYDGNGELVGDDPRYDVWVAEAERLVDNGNCTDTPASWYSAFFFLNDGIE